MKTWLSVAVSSLALAFIAAPANAQTTAQSDALAAVGSEVCPDASWDASEDTWHCEGDTLGLHFSVYDDGTISRWWRMALILPGTLGAAIEAEYPGAEVASVERIERTAGPRTGANNGDPEPIQYAVRFAHEGNGYAIRMTSYGEITRTRTLGSAPESNTPAPLDYDNTPAAVDASFASIADACPDVMWRWNKEETRYMAKCGDAQWTRAMFTAEGTLRRVATTIFTLPVLAGDVIADLYADMDIVRYRRIESIHGDHAARYRVAMNDADGDRVSAVISPMGDFLRSAERIGFDELPSDVAATATSNASGDFLRAWRIETDDFVRYRVIYDNVSDDSRRTVILEDDGSLVRIRDWTPRC